MLLCRPLLALALRPAAVLFVHTYYFVSFLYVLYVLFIFKRYLGRLFSADCFCILYGFRARPAYLGRSMKFYTEIYTFILIPPLPFSNVFDNSLQNPPCTCLISEHISVYGDAVLLLLRCCCGFMQVTISSVHRCRSNFRFLLFFLSSRLC